MVPLNKSTASLSHHNTVWVSMTNVVVPQDGVTSSSDVHSSPLVLLDDIFWIVFFFLNVGNYLETQDSVFYVNGTSNQAHRYWCVKGGRTAWLSPVIIPLPFSLTATPAAWPWKMWFPLSRRSKQRTNKSGTLAWIGCCICIQIKLLKSGITTLPSTYYIKPWV